jgi:5'-nucleotidase
MNKKNILITNDDGFDAVGLKHLVEALKPIANIMIAAPATNKSACAHSMTLTKPLSFKSFDDDSYYLEDGTPTDCIFLGLHNLYPEGVKPDLVVSGINVGSNMGEDITYSGTVAGAMEAVLQGVPGISISQVFDAKAKELGDLYDYTLAKKIVAEIVAKILDGGFPLEGRKLLNINIPPCSVDECQGIAITKAGYRIYGNDSHRHHDPRGNEYYWIGLHPLVWECEDKSSDFEAIKANKVSITPIKLDLTSYEDIDRLNTWL